MKALKILVLSDYAFSKGGAERVAISSSMALSGMGHEVVFFSAVGPVDNELSRTDLKELICLNQEDILDNPNKLAAMLSGIYNWKAIRRLKKLFSYWIPDIAHIHGVSKALSWAPINLISSYGIPVVYTLHDYGLVCPNLGIYNFRTEKVCEYYKPGFKFKCMIENCDKRSYAQKLWRWLRYCIVKKIYKINKKINGYISVSKFMGELARKYLAEDKPVRDIYNPVEINKNAGGKCKDIKKKPVNFLYVGRLSLEKGIDLLLKVMTRIDAGLTIIGDGELIDMCRDYAGKTGKGKIKVLGYQGREKIFIEMRKSSILVLPSRCMEPAPLVLAEAAYNCVPSIVADHGGLIEFVEDGINGIHFEAGNEESLKNSMESIIKNPSLSGILGKRAREIIIEKDLSIDNHLNQVEKYYADILGM